MHTHTSEGWLAQPGRMRSVRDQMHSQEGAFFLGLFRHAGARRSVASCAA